MGDGGRPPASASCVDAMLVPVPQALFAFRLLRDDRTVSAYCIGLMLSCNSDGSTSWDCRLSAGARCAALRLMVARGIRVLDPSVADIGSVSTSWRASCGSPKEREMRGLV